MILYHVSRKVYVVGDVINANEFSNVTEYYEKSEKENKNWIDDYLDSMKPQNAPSRKRVIYAFDSLANCGAFMVNNITDFNYYKVEMKEPVACPMCLTDNLEENNSEKNATIAKEYWNPTESWKFLEYLSEEMTIVEILPPPNFIEVASGKMAYGSDRTLSNKLFK